MFDERRILRHEIEERSFTGLEIDDFCRVHEQNYFIFKSNYLVVVNQRCRAKAYNETPLETNHHVSLNNRIAFIKISLSRISY